MLSAQTLLNAQTGEDQDDTDNEFKKQASDDDDEDKVTRSRKS